MTSVNKSTGQNPTKELDESEIKESEYLNSEVEAYIEAIESRKVKLTRYSPQDFIDHIDKILAEKD